jgi:hypothetical protein
MQDVNVKRNGVYKPFVKETQDENDDFCPNPTLGRV